MDKKTKKPRKLGLWIPHKILKMPFLSSDEKQYYAYVYSFGGRGCWQTDMQIGKALGCSIRTIQRYQTSCKKAGLFKVIGERSKYRRIWAKNHPEYKATQKKRVQELRQTCQSRQTNLSELPRQTCPTTNKFTNKKTIKERGGSPLPPEGPARAPLRDKQEQLEEHRKKEDAAISIEQMKKNFGFGCRWPEPLSGAEIHRLIQQQKEALYGDKKI